MSKISELSDGGAIQGGDTLIAVRSGGNVKVTYGGSTTANIDGGTIDGTVIGGSTAAAGSFTTLTASGDVNFDSGTLFVDASANAVGIGTSSPAAELDVSGEIRSRTTDGFVINNGSELGALRYSGGLVINRISGSNLFFQAGQSSQATLDPSGNLGIGTISPAGRLTLRGAAGTSGKNQGISIEYSNGTEYAALGLNNSTGWPQLMARAGAGITFHTNSDLVTTGEAMRIDSAGNVGIGCTPDTALNAFGYTVLEVAGANTTKSGAILLSNSSGTDFAQIYADNTNGLNFVNSQTTKSTIFYGGSGTAEQMRIDSSGNLLVGTTTAEGANSVTMYGGDVTEKIVIQRNSSLGKRHISFKNTNGIVGTISTSGSATSYSTSSDQRLKENITDAPAGNIDDIKVRSFDWKADGSHQDYGMVAQELEAVAPYAVTKGETEDDMWSVDYSKLVPMLIKEIQDLKAEVAALKGAN